MDDAAAARDAARAVLDDIEPSRLRKLIETRLQETAVTPGVLTRMSARAAGDLDASPDLDRRVAGVQLVYEGLSMTCSMARAPPWETGATDAADMDMLVANVLVARGFYLLARTEAADTAVETVRTFGRDETVAESRSGVEPGPGTLEADIFELAIMAGVSSQGESPPPGSRAFAGELAQSLQACGEGLPEGTDDALELLITGDRQAGPLHDGVEASGATDSRG
jgi:hypothetical protein